MSQTIRDKVTVPGIRARKASRAGQERIVALTAYDHPTARALDRAGADVLLVGDSLGMVVLGLPSTLSVTLDMMVHHTAAVARALPRALVVADMPFLSYHTGPADAVRNAGRLVQEAGAEAVKIEGGRVRVEVLRALCAAEIPVMGHLGLTPQSVNVLGGYRVQGKRLSQVEVLVEDARALEEAGVFAIVLEGMPAAAGALITRSVGVPTIGIGAGPECDGQVLVTHDLIGLGEGASPRFVRRYDEVSRRIEEAAGRFASDVRAGSFPSPRESYPATAELDALEKPDPARR
ncbi:MAG TPA: 3-methyl-2-oxobutanoate hydroxymethyltransferase [Candidatus Polarisedimenticolia bacterium]|nr:3-methyl-2-oxobutanoate hydroxymethyltransferase [Candidatus Polarisedimenticolia bacterium]